MRQFLTTTILFTTLISFGQSYEGTLTYVADFKVSEKLVKMGITKQTLLDKMKSEGSWSDTIRTSYNKHGDYYTLRNTSPKSWSIYKTGNNKIYAMQDGEASDICAVTDAVDLEFTITGKTPTAEKLDSIVIIDGVSCSLVRITWKSGTYDYYYNQTKFTVDGSLFAKHTYDGWAGFLKIANALPIRIVKTTKGMMSLTMTLISSKTDVVDEKLFSIPKLVHDKDLNIIKVPNTEMMRIKK